MTDQLPPMGNTNPPHRKRFLWKWVLYGLLSKLLRGREEIIEILRIGEEKNLIAPDTLIMMEGALAVSEIRVKDIMIPRIHMVCIHHNNEPKKILETVIESGHSRFPVIAENDEVIGILLAKDLLNAFAEHGKQALYIKDIMRPATFIPESKRLNVLLREFKLSRNHMAIVVDEYSSTVGLVTIEDIIEEIIGEIEDEHDYQAEENIRSHKKNRFIVNALTPIEDFNHYFNTTLKDDNYDTIGGLIMNAFGHLPKRGEIIEYKGFHATILRADKRKIKLIRMIRTPSPEETPKK